MFAISARIAILSGWPVTRSWKDVPEFQVNAASENGAVATARQIMDPWGLTPEKDIDIEATRI
jgi:hypothetical protein